MFEDLPCQDGIGSETVQTISMVGLGTIGRSWTALMLAQGLDVVGYDPSPGVVDTVADEVKAQEEPLRALGLIKEKQGSFKLAASLEEAVNAADMVQENGPESLPVKRDLISAITKAAPPHVVVASSTSGLMPSELASAAEKPERVIVGHPMLPVTIMPLVEVVGGANTSGAAINWALELYQRLGKKTVVVRKETPGFLVNRFQTVVFEEALSLIENRVATVEDIETVFSEGAGLRWSLYGPISLVALAAGNAGLAESYRRFAEYQQRIRSSIKPVSDHSAAMSLAQEQASNLEVVRDVDNAIVDRDSMLVAIRKLKAEQSRDR